MEIVDQEIENVLPAFRAAIHCELLTEGEVKQIILRRKKDEAKLIKRECNLADYINFLHRDTMIFKLIAKRRKNSKYTNKLDEIEYKLLARLTRLMKRAQRLWPDNMAVWATHIALCEKWNKRTQLSKLYEEMISRHPHNVDVWIAAAKFHLERNGSVDQSRKLLLRAQQQIPNSSEIYDQLFRIELIHAAQINKRLNVAGGSTGDSESTELAEKDVRQGAAAVGIFLFIRKNFPDNFGLLYNMVVQAKSLTPPIDNVTDQLIASFMDLKEVNAVEYQAEYLRRFTPGGVEAAINLYNSAIVAHSNEIDFIFKFIKFLQEHKNDEAKITELLNRILDVLDSQNEPIPESLQNGKFVRCLCESKLEKRACDIQQQIVRENDQNERERFILLKLAVELKSDDDTVKGHFELLFKSDNKEIEGKTIELCSEWCGNIEGRLLWFATKKSEGKCHLVQLRDSESRKRAVETLLQQSASKPIDTEFLKLGIELLQGEYESDIIRFVDKCCLMESSAEMWIELLKLYSREKLNELGNVFLRAKSHLSPTEFESLNQRWQLLKI